MRLLPVVLPPLVALSATGVLILLLLLSSCAGSKTPPLALPKITKLPDSVKFYVNPSQKSYLPYQRIKLNLWVKDKGSFQRDLQIKTKEISRIKLTPLSTIDSAYSYHVDWAGIHRNSHGRSGRTTRITWYLPSNWAGIIPQQEGEYLVSFNISTPVGHWQTEEFLFRIKVPAEEVIPYNDLLAAQIDLFYEYEYVVRTNNSNWSTSKDCPTKRLPFEQLSLFLAKYPYSRFSKSLLVKLEKTKRIIKNDQTKYDEEDMAELENVLARFSE